MRIRNPLGRGPGTRIAGAAIGIAGLAFIGLGTAGVGTVTQIAHASAPTNCPADTTVPTSGVGCVNESFEGTTAATSGAANDCGSYGLTANATTDGWVFVLPQGDSDGDSGGGAETNTFVSVTAVFGTTSYTVTSTPNSFGSVTGPPTGQKAVVSVPANSVLTEAYATITDGDADGSSTGFFTVTGVCVNNASTSSTTTSSTAPSTSTGETTSTGESTSSTCTEGSGDESCGGGAGEGTCTDETGSSETESTSSTCTTSNTTDTTSTTGGTGGASTAVTSSSGAATVVTPITSGTLGISTTTPLTGADGEFGAGLALITLGGGIFFAGLARRKRA